MAKQVEGYMGGFSGRLGPAVGYCWRGRWCLRAAPREVRNPRTVAQQSHRMAFRQMVLLSSSMHDALRIGMRAESLAMGMTECNLFARLNKDFVTEDSIEFAMLRVSCGPVAPVGFGAPVVDGNNVLTVSFERNPLHVLADGTDNVYLYLHCPEAGGGMLSAPVQRRSGRIAVALPDEWRGLAIHVYGFVVDYHGWASESAYISLSEEDNANGGDVELSGCSPMLGDLAAEERLTEECVSNTDSHSIHTPPSDALMTHKAMPGMPLASLSPSNLEGVRS